MTTIELNLDGLIGPTHHYAGLSYGNRASIAHTHQVAYPKQAALQGLKKMRLLYDLGVAQAVMPPAPRPNLHLLEQCGFDGTPSQMIHAAFHQAPHILSACFSASSMWTANAASVTPAQDSRDQKIHLTPANLVANLHRSQEAEFTYRVFKKIFNHERYFKIHEPLPFTHSLADEGAANSQRICRTHHHLGVHVLVFGRSAFQRHLPTPQQYPARQSLEALEAVSRQHQRYPERLVYVQQSPQAIDAGAFHHDVVGLNNESVLILHEQAWLHQDQALQDLQQRLDFPLTLIQIPHHQLTLEQAVQSYFFNSQLVTLPRQNMALIAPQECLESPAAQHLIEQLQQQYSAIIKSVHYIDLRQSMHNGGGPACLRLRIPMPASAYETMHRGVIFTPLLEQQLEHWIHQHYRESLAWQDLLDPHLIDETRDAYHALTDILKIDDLYN